MVGKIIERPAIITATLGGQGQGEVRAKSGAQAVLAGLASEEGFTPVELMDAALAGCLVLSFRIAARKRGWGARLRSIAVDVIHHKASEGASRVQGFDCCFTIDGDFSQTERADLIAEAHAICTVGNTLHAGAQMRDIEEIPQ